MGKRPAASHDNLTRRLIAEHLVDGDPSPGKEIALRIDQTMTQDSNGTLAFLQLEALGIKKVQTRISVSYVDHNLLQLSFESADDHRYLQTIASKLGAHFSRPGNGIGHRVHLERFGVPGETLLGTDVHCTTAGALGMLAMGAGAMDVALAMAGQPYRMEMPRVVNVVLKGKPGPWVGAKDISLELLRRLTVKGGVGKAFEFSGDGLKSLPLSERAIIANMCAELGATAAVFPADEMAKSYLKRQRRLNAYKPLGPDKGATYDEELVIDLKDLQPLVAKPPSPDSVVGVSEVAGTAVTQICIGGSTNSTLRNLMTVAALLKGQTVHPSVNLTITPGSRQVVLNMIKNGTLYDLMKAGARILEPGYGPSAGIGQAPETGGVSLRTFNRNYPGTAGTRDCQVYLCGPVVAALSALTGKIEDPAERKGRAPTITMPAQFETDDSLIVPPTDKPERVDVHRGPNIKPVPMKKALSQDLIGSVLIRVGDNITTDDILPTSPAALALRSNIPRLSEFCFRNVDPTFVNRAKSVGGGFIIAGENYGQGSAREHAALVPMFLGIKAVLAKSFARIHRQNLINCGILPLLFADPTSYDDIQLGDVIEIPFARIFLADDKPLVVKNTRSHKNYAIQHLLTPKQIEIVLAGGLLNLTREGLGLETPESKSKGRRNK